MSGRTYCVIYAGTTSTAVYIVCSVTQGSVLGPSLFVLYVAILAEIVDQHGVKLHSFANDTQLYLHCLHADNNSAAIQLQVCIANTSQWMMANRLKLNSDHTELFEWIETQRIPGPGPWSSYRAGPRIPRCSPTMWPCPAAWHYHFGWFESWSAHICCQLDILQLASSTLASLLLTWYWISGDTRLCFCKIQDGLLQSVVGWMQQSCHRQITASYECFSAVVSSIMKYDHGLTQLHAALHWLDVADRVIYKLCMMVHHCFYSQAPDYLSETCMPVAQVAEWKHLRSASRRLLVMPWIQWTCMAAVLLPRLVRQSGICWAMICATQTSSLPVLVTCWRCICFSGIQCIACIRGTVP